LERLARQLGVPVVPVQAHRRLGMESLKEALDRAGRHPAPVVESPFPQAFLDEVERLESLLAAGELGPGPALPPRYLVERLLGDTGGYIEERMPRNGTSGHLREELHAARERLGQAGYPVPAVETMARYGWVTRAVEGVVPHPVEPVPSWGDRLDAILTH